jgi:TonB family protein
VIRAVIDSEPPAPEPAERRYFVPVLLGAVVLVAVGWAAVAFFRGASHTNTVAQNPVPAVVSQAQNAPVETPQATPPAAAPAKVPVPVDTTSPGAASVSRTGDSLADRSVTHEDIPSVPARARATIHGHIKITVHVTIDDTGAVVSDSLVRPGPSKYFARLASRSARRWHFDPASGPGTRQALIRFDFVRSGTSAHVVTPD